MRRNHIFMIGVLASLTYVLTKRRAAPDKQFTTAITADGVTITKYNGHSKAVTIPAHIHNRPVIRVAQQAFKDKNLHNVTLPNTIQHIDNWAFANNKLTQLILPNELISIGDWAFYNNALTTLTLPPQLTSIGDWAFYDNVLTSLTCCPTLTNMGNWAFAFNALTTLTLPSSLANKVADETFHHNPIKQITYEREWPPLV